MKVVRPETLRMLVGSHVLGFVDVPDCFEVVLDGDERNLLCFHEDGSITIGSVSEPAFYASESP